MIDKLLLKYAVSTTLFYHTIKLELTNHSIPNTKKTPGFFPCNEMPSQLPNINTPSKVSCFPSLVLAYFLFCFCLGLAVEADNSYTNIGTIIDVDSRVGKEHKTAMTMAIHKFNNDSRNHTLNIYFRNTSRDPVQVVSIAEELISQKQVQVIIGTRTWEEAALAADVGKQAQVPVLSLAAASTTPLMVQNRWPFLVEMATDSLEQMKCITAIIKSYHWRQVIAIHEDNSYFPNSGMLTMLTESLQNVGVEIEYDLVLPAFSSLTDPEEFVRQEVAKLLWKQSRVFIVLQSSIPLATLLFREAKQLGLMGRDSVWILTDTISDLLDSVDTSFILSMQGAIGIKNYFSENTNHFLDFKNQFRKNFRAEYPHDDNTGPGCHALKAYDSVTAIAKAVRELGRHNTTNTISLLSKIISNNFTGLSGEIRFHGAKLEQKPIFKIVNIVGKGHKELGIWSSNFGFSGSYVEEKGSGAIDLDMKKLPTLVNWPGELDRVPKGWAMPTISKPMKIGIPGNSTAPAFVRVEWGKSNETSGFCIDLFEKVLGELKKNYTLHYEFVPFNGSYGDLVENVINKNFDAAVGDITILANRSKYVEFTQPFIESGLTMLVPVKREPQMTWIFMKPFTRNMWIVTSAILFYTMFVIWFMERQSNQEFQGPWKDQLVTALWFTFSSLFYAHREKVKSNYTKLVLVFWLFVAFVLTSSYQASLTSMLTIPRLEPRVTGIEWIKATNATVGCDGDSFVEDYLQGVLNLPNIKNVNSQDRYPEEFNSGTISAAFLELPYQRLFLKDRCKEYTVTGPTYNFGGLGFVFKKNSPIARDVSEAILTLMENGTLKRLKEAWLGPSNSCSKSETDSETDSLSLKSFWGLYLVSAAVSTISFLIFILRLLKSKSKDSKTYAYDLAQAVDNVPNTTVDLRQILQGKRPKSLRRRNTFTWSNDTQLELVSPADASEIYSSSTV